MAGYPGLTPTLEKSTRDRGWRTPFNPAIRTLNPTFAAFPITPTIPTKEPAANVHPTVTTATSGRVSGQSPAVC